MSAEHVGWAFRQPLPATRKFVLVALADRCNKDTLRCDPSMSRVAEDTGLDRSTVIRAIAALVEDGYITKVERTRQNGSASTNAYQFPDVGGSRTAPPPQSQGATTPSRTAPPPEPELEPEVEPDLAASPQERPRNPLWDTLTHMFGPATTRSNETKRGKIVRELKAAGATPEEMLKRGKAWPRHFDTATLTETALLEHWDRLGRKPLRAGGR